MASSNYSISHLVANQGSGSRSSANYQIEQDVLALQPLGQAASASYSLTATVLPQIEGPLPSCGIFINGNAAATSNNVVQLSMLCGHSSGCQSMEISNNSVSWTGPVPYATSFPWTLPAIDGTRNVFARFTNGLGNRSPPCSDSIVLDTTAPNVGISPTGGTYFSPQVVAITATEPATIRYTTDGSDPASSPTASVYLDPLTIANNLTLSANAEDIAGLVGATVSETYEICGGSNLSLSGSVIDATLDRPMPLVVITLDSGHQATTDPNGDYTFSGLPGGFYLIESVTAPVSGYALYQDQIKLCETSVAQDISLTRIETVFGFDTNSGYSLDAVNTSTGNFSYRVTDLALPGVGQSFAFTRAYNSQNPVNGPLGYGWTWSYGTRVSSGPDGELVVKWGDGRIEVWAPDGSGGYAPMYGVFSTLALNPDSTFTLKQKDLMEYHFDAAGRLVRIEDEYGNTISFGYSGQNIVSITDTASRIITLSYDAQSRITNVLDSGGRSLAFTYDGAGNLVSSRDLAGQLTQYTYDANHQMLTVRDPRGHTQITNIYDNSRRVVTSLRDAVGGETRYVYDPPTRTTTIIDALGNTAYHEFDELLRLVRETDALGYSVSNSYDERGNLVQTVDRNGNPTSFTHDANGNILTKTEPLGRVSETRYDANNNPIEKIDALGRREIFDYDPGNFNLIRSFACGLRSEADCRSDTDVRRVEYGYDARGKLITVTDGAGTPLARTTTYAYDLSGNRISTTDALGAQSTFAHDSLGRKLVESFPLGRGAAYEYDAMDRLLSVTDALGGLNSYGYDASGNKISHTNARGHTTTYGYDAKNRLISETLPIVGAETYTYDGLDRRTRLRDRRGNETSVVYDAVGNVVQERDAIGNTVFHEYDGNRNRIKTTNARGFDTHFSYDALNRLISQTDALGGVVSFQYDLAGNLLSRTEVTGETTTHAYDEFNRKISTTSPRGSVVVQSYDLLDRLLSITDARGNAIHFEYDALNRLISVLDQSGNAFEATYDALGNRLALADARANILSYEYDVLNRLLRELDPLGNSEEYSYDPNGNLLRLTTFEGATSYTYDALDRLVAVTFPDGEVHVASYDANSNQTAVTEPQGTTTFQYDQMNRISQVSDVLGAEIGYAYDGNGNKSTIRYSQTRSVNYQFDPLDRMFRIQDWMGVVTQYNYDGAGRLVGEVMGNGVLVSYEYDSDGFLASKIDVKPGLGVLQSSTVQRDPNGNINTVSVLPEIDTDAPLTSSFRSFNESNEMIERDGETISFDNQGRRINEAFDFGGRVFRYNTRGLLTSVERGSDGAYFTYDFSGARVSREREDGRTSFLIDRVSQYPLDLEETIDGVVVRSSVFGRGLAYSHEGGELVFYHTDPLGNVIATTDSSAEILSRSEFLPYGGLLARSGHNISPFGFAGYSGAREESFDLIFFRSRFFDTAGGVFLSRDRVKGDLISPATLNRYSYAVNNPVNYSDPSGDFVDLIVDLYFLGSAINDIRIVSSDESATTLEKVGAYVGFGLALGAVFDPTGALTVAGALYDAGRGAIGDNCNANIACHVGRQQTAPLRDALDAVNDLRTVDETSSSVDLACYEAACIQRYQSTVRQSVATSVRGHFVGRPTTSVSGGLSADALPADASASSGGSGRQIRKKDGNVSGFAKSEFRRIFSRILDPSFLDSQSRSVAEQIIAAELNTLQSVRLTYTSRTKERALKRRADIVRASGDRVYAQMVQALSKHEVLVRDMAALPSGATGGIVKAGVYAQ